MSFLDDELNARTRRFAADITALLRGAIDDAVNSALNAPRRNTPAPTSRGATRPKNGRGSSLDVETVFAEVKRKGGRGVEDLARSLRTSTKTLRLPLQKLIAAKKVKTRG